MRPRPTTARSTPEPLPVTSLSPIVQTAGFAGLSRRVSDGTRTRDRLDHNQELYQLSYAHHGISAGV
jgi:hypothetical protein